jgi:hypothetical protein
MALNCLDGKYPTRQLSGAQQPRFPKIARQKLTHCDISVGSFAVVHNSSGFELR